LAAVQPEVIRSQKQHRATTRLTGQVQHTTEVQVPEHHPEVTVPLLQVRIVTGAVHLQAAETTAAEVQEVEEAAVHILQAVQAVVHFPAVAVADIPAAAAVVVVLQEVAHHHQVGDNFRKYL
jgi:hypothetical protein